VRLASVDPTGGAAPRPTGSIRFGGRAPTPRALGFASIVAAIIAVGLVTGCGGPSKPGPSKPGVGSRGPRYPGDTQRGYASWYGGSFHGRKTASGERFNKNALTAAHRTLPLGSRVRVTHARSGATVTVRINDRGPYSRGRIIDLSEAAARRLGIVRSGVALVVLYVVSVPGRR